MMRPSPADSIDEILRRHGQAVTFGIGDAETLASVIAACYDGGDIDEIYVRTEGSSVFAPMFEEHTASPSLSWAICCAPAYPSEPRIVGIMLAKDEADAIPEVLKSVQGLDALYYFAGDPETAAAVAAWPRPGWAREVRVPKVPHADGLRQYLLDAARADAVTDGDTRPMWVVNVQGDEVYCDDDLRAHVLRAHRERATVLNSHVATFLLHESQAENWDWQQPLLSRLTHYIWDFGEHAAFRDFPWTRYVVHEHMRAHPHGLVGAKWASIWPVRRHYPFRSPEQARARLEDRLRPRAEQPAGWQPHYRNYRHIFMRDYAAGREVKRFTGTFPELAHTQRLTP